MAPSVTEYERDLPEVPSRHPWTKPTSHLVKDTSADSQWRVDDSGRRPSNLLLVDKIRQSVDAWRDGGYLGASEVSLRLLDHWFEQDHVVEGIDVPFRYHFCQREAIESLIWLVEVAGITGSQHLIKSFAHIVSRDPLSNNLNLRTTIDGRPQLLTHDPSSASPMAQVLPPDGLRRFAFKMATGSGKTWVMAMTIVWSYFHKMKVPSSTLSTNFLIVSPNAIVRERLAKDFVDSEFFARFPLIPPEWRHEFRLDVILRDEPKSTDIRCNIFLADIHQLYPETIPDKEPINAADVPLRSKPKPQNSTLDASRTALLDRIMAGGDLVVFNDEAHHVYDEGMQWSKSLIAMSEQVPSDVVLWLDYSATPKDQHGNYFPWIICDYPLAQAVEDRIVKAPIIFEYNGVKAAVGFPQEQITSANAIDRYRTLIVAGIERLVRHTEVYAALGIKPVLFIMTETNTDADRVGEYLVRTAEFNLDQSEVLVIRTDDSGEIRKGDLEIAMETARDIDTPANRIKVIVSAMMLREGWDVRNVTVVLGLLPFSAKAEILPEQVIGRGLRPIPKVTPDRTQTLEVLGTPNLLRSLRQQLEAEGVGIGVTGKPPELPVIIQPLKDRVAYDIEIPISRPSLENVIRRLADFDISQLDAIYSQELLNEPLRLELRTKFATTETEDGGTEVAVAAQQLPEAEVLKGVTMLVGAYTGNTHQFSILYPIVSRYIQNRCFGGVVSLDDHRVRQFLSQLEVREAIARYLSLAVPQLRVERRHIELVDPRYHLSATKPFSWRRDLPALVSAKSVFNFVATHNGFEREFAKFLDVCDDISRFAALGATDQGSSGTTFRVEYAKPRGAIGFYYPDWVAVQESDIGIVNWIIGTKGRVGDDTEERDGAIREWCEQVSRLTGDSWKHLRVNESEFSSQHPSFRSLSVRLIANRMFRRRAKQPRAVSLEMIRAIREEVRR